MKKHRVDSAAIRAALNSGQSEEVIRAIYGRKVPPVIPVWVLLQDSKTHFEFHGTRRIFTLPTPAFRELLR